MFHILNIHSLCGCVDTDTVKIDVRFVIDGDPPPPPKRGGTAVEEPEYEYEEWTFVEATYSNSAPWAGRIFAMINPYQFVTGTGETVAQRYGGDNFPQCEWQTKICFAYVDPEGDYNVEYSEGTSAYYSTLLYPTFWVKTYPPGDYDKDFIVDSEELAIAEKFKPVLIKHPAELQQNLGNFENLFYREQTSLHLKLRHGNDINSFDAFHPFLNGNTSTHIWGVFDEDGYCTHGLEHWETNESKFVFDYNNPSSAYYAGAPAGQRPLYYHVYKDNDYFYVQYWYWFDLNDIRGQTEAGCWHEGDWEHFSIKLEKNAFGEFVPIKLNMFQHNGGTSQLPIEGKWSVSNVICDNVIDNYSDTHTHPIIYIAANSHASYFAYQDSLYQSIYDYFCVSFNYGLFYGIINEFVYYNYFHGQKFSYDYLENLGEAYTVFNKAIHGRMYHDHSFVKGNSQEWLAFKGRFGNYWRINNILEDILTSRTPSPRSPYHQGNYLYFYNQLYW